MKFNIYSEGYAATCEHGKAQFFGVGEGDTFKEAVVNWYNSVEDAKFHYGELNANLDNDKPPTTWGCRLFTSLSEAQESYG